MVSMQYEYVYEWVEVGFLIKFTGSVCNPMELEYSEHGGSGSVGVSWAGGGVACMAPVSVSCFR